MTDGSSLTCNVFYVHATCLDFPTPGEWKESSCGSGGQISSTVFGESE